MKLLNIQTLLKVAIFLPECEGLTKFWDSYSGFENPSMENFV